MKNLNTIMRDSVKTESNKITKGEKHRLKNEILFMVGALVSLFCGLIFKAIYPKQEIVVCLLYLCGVIIIGVPVFITAVRGLIKNDASASMEILVTIAIAACVISNQYILGILIPVILTLVHFLEEKSIVGGRDAIESLKKIQANTAIILEDGLEKTVDARILKPGDTILLKPGMSIPIDGIVLLGESSVNQQSLTGESHPVYVGINSKVFAGTINIEGALTVKVEKAFKDTSFQQIVSLLEETSNMTASETKIIDKFLVYYIPLALIVAIMTWLFTRDISRAIAILVVSCPCGYMFVNSAPVLSAFAKATKRGILIKDASFINKLGDADCIVFDKTGTITNGYLEAVNYYLDKAESYEELIKTAACATCKSLHPVSKSITALCEDIGYDSTFTVKEFIGCGVIAAKGEDTKVIIGNRRWLTELGYAIEISYEEEGAVTWVIKNDAIFGCLLFTDTARSDAKKTIEQLKAMGIEKSVLLTGDNHSSASKIKDTVGIDGMCCNMLPEDKYNKVRELKNEHTVIVVGDGINDALALSEADVGIAMGAMGSDTAIQSADIALMSNSLDNIPFIISLARKTKKIILENMVIAFATSFVMIILAATGVVSALLGAILHNLGAFIVLLNSGKLMKGKEDINNSEKIIESK